MAQQVQFVQLTQSEYDALASKDAGKLYFTTDSGRIYKGGEAYSPQRVFYGTCSTAAGTATKEVTCAQFTSSDFVAGTVLLVKFSANNSSTTPSIKVGGSTKRFYRYGTTNPVSYMWYANQIVEFVFDGTYWLMVTPGPATTSYEGVVKLTNSTSSTSTTTAATPNSVKTAYDLANAAVPTSRTIAGQALSADITAATLATAIGLDNCLKNNSSNTIEANTSSLGFEIYNDNAASGADAYLYLASGNGEFGISTSSNDTYMLVDGHEFRFPSVSGTLLTSVPTSYKTYADTLTQLGTDGYKTYADTKTSLDSVYKPLQTATTDPTASGNSTTFIATITQNANGVISATKKSVNFSGYKPTQTAKSSPTASGSTTSFIDTISQDANGVITATKKNVDFSSYVPTSRKINGTALTSDLSVGTITGITMNGASKGTSGVVDLGTVLTSHQSLDSCLKNTGDQTISSCNRLTLKSATMDHTVVPESTVQSPGLALQDKNAYVIGQVLCDRNTTGRQVTFMKVRQTINGADSSAEIGVAIDADNTKYAWCPTPPASSNDTKIATTAWVRSRMSGDYVSKSALAAAVAAAGTVPSGDGATLSAVIDKYNALVAALTALAT